MSTILTPPEARAGDPRARVRAARPDLPPDSSAFRAAVVLLAGPALSCNVDRIAVRCALPRGWVAACVRRLIDNGVWAAGCAVYPWRGPDDPRFWNDAAVAEGRLLRRTLPGGGVEWAPPGRWEKAYDFVGPQSDPGGAVLYLDPACDPRPSLDVQPAPAERDEVDPAFAEAPAETDEDGPRIHLSAPHLVAAGWMEEPAAAGVGAGVPELFPDAEWLR